MIFRKGRLDADDKRMEDVIRRLEKLEEIEKNNQGHSHPLLAERLEKLEERNKHMDAENRSKPSHEHVNRIESTLRSVHDRVEKLESESKTYIDKDRWIELLEERILNLEVLVSRCPWATDTRSAVNPTKKEDIPAAAAEEEEYQKDMFDELVKLSEPRHKEWNIAFAQVLRCLNIKLNIIIDLVKVDD